MCSTGRSQQSVHLQRRGGEICLPEDGLSAHGDADGGILVGGRQKHETTGNGLSLNLSAKKLNTTPPPLPPPQLIQNKRRWTAQLYVCKSTEDIYCRLKAFYRFTATLHFTGRVFKDELWGVVLLLSHGEVQVLHF